MQGRRAGKECTMARLSRLSARNHTVDPVVPEVRLNLDLKNRLYPVQARWTARQRLTWKHWVGGRLVDPSFRLTN